MSSKTAIFLLCNKLASKLLLHQSGSRKTGISVAQSSVVKEITLRITSQSWFVPISTGQSPLSTNPQQHIWYIGSKLYASPNGRGISPNRTPIIKKKGSSFETRLNGYRFFFHPEEPPLRPQWIQRQIKWSFEISKLNTNNISTLTNINQQQLTQLIARQIAFRQHPAADN